MTRRTQFVLLGWLLRLRPAQRRRRPGGQPRWFTIWASGLVRSLLGRFNPELPHELYEAFLSLGISRRTTVSHFISHLQSFNRKERFLLLKRTLGENTFSLDPSFRKELADRIDCPVPSDAFVAMDYHLNWLQIALEYRNTSLPDSVPNDLFPLDQQVQLNQQDIDLLIAFRDGSYERVVLIEAKADTSWDNPQLNAKAERLNGIFTDGDRDVIPHFLLMSPSPSSNIETEGWPDWMMPNERLHIELPLGDELVKIEGLADGQRILRERKNRGDRWVWQKRA